jgi:hypothetical protein
MGENGSWSCPKGTVGEIHVGNVCMKLKAPSLAILQTELRIERGVTDVYLIGNKDLGLEPYGFCKAV